LLAPSPTLAFTIINHMTECRARLPRAQFDTSFDGCFPRYLDDPSSGTH
jgi:hypothetical protein